MSVLPEASEPRWPIPPEGGWTADDLDRLPNLPPHTELIDGSLVFVSPQTVFHVRAVGFFKQGLEAAAPPDLEVIREFTIDIDWQNRPEPDVVIVNGGAIVDPEQTRFLGHPGNRGRLPRVHLPGSGDQAHEVRPGRYPALLTSGKRQGPSRRLRLRA